MAHLILSRRIPTISLLAIHLTLYHACNALVLTPIVVGNEQNCTKVSNISQIWVALTSMQMCNYEWTFIKRFCAFFASPHFKLVGSCKNRSIAGKTEHMYVDRCSPRILRCGIDISRYFAAFFT